MIRISWDPVDNADYYVVYHDDFREDCNVNRFGIPVPHFNCERIVSELAVTHFDHSNRYADDDDNYWIGACNRSGCSLTVAVRR